MRWKRGRRPTHLVWHWMQRLYWIRTDIRQLRQVHGGEFRNPLLSNDRKETRPMCIYKNLCLWACWLFLCAADASVCNKWQWVVWISESVIWKQVPAQCTSCKPANYKCAMLSEKEPRKITMAAECWGENKSSRLLSGGGLRPGGALKQTLHQVVSLCDIIASVLNFPLLHRWATATSDGVSVALSGQRQPPTAASLY